MAANLECTSKMEVIMSDLDEIIEHIMIFLSMQELQVCSRVCRKWNRACRRIKATRKQMHWLFVEETDLQNVAVDVKKHVQSMPSLPIFALLFCSNDLHDSKIAVPSLTSARPRASKMERVDVSDYFKRLLPRGCDIIGCCAQGIVGTPSNTTKAEELEDDGVVSCLLLPRLEDVEISHFLLTPHMETLLDNHRVNAHITRPPMEVVSRILGIPAGKQPKLILLLETDTGVIINMQRSHTTYYMLLKCYDTIIAGASAYELYPDSTVTEGHESPCHTLGIAFTGDNVKAASVLLSEEVTTRKEVEEKLRKLLKCHVPQSHRVGLMFACEGRGEGHFQERNVESSIFHELFPGVPLLGFFGQGELGCDYLPDYTADSQSVYSLLGEYVDLGGEDCDLPNFSHTYTTVFVLLSLGSK